MSRPLLVCLLAAACGPDRVADVVRERVPIPPQHPDIDEPPNPEPTDGDGGTVITEPLLAFIGSPCVADGDCPYEGGVCMRDAEGFPGGMCSAPCDRYCPDATGYPTTFCVDPVDLPPAADALGDGGCVSRCDFGAYADGGCRADYGCVRVPRANEPETEQYACLPDTPPDPASTCWTELAARGVAFEPLVVADRAPSTHPDLTCRITDPVKVKSPLLGVDLVYHTGSSPASVTAACDMAHALADTALDVADAGADVLRHLGTYNCRVISGTDTLSRHAYADAIDIWGFDLADGTAYTLEDHWEHDAPEPQAEGGQFLYDAAHRWHDDLVWNVILTPDYNAAHDNHFHVDLTPGSDFLGSTRELEWLLTRRDDELRGRSGVR